MIFFIFGYFVILTVGVHGASEYGEIDYVDENGALKTTPSGGTITKITGYVALNSGWYYAEGTESPPTAITVTRTTEPGLILKDGCDLTIYGIYETGDPGTNINPYVAKLKIYGQTLGTGKLTVKGNLRTGEPGVTYAGISLGKLTINGGVITVNGGDKGAGIGGDPNKDGGEVIINGGVVDAKGGTYAAGIGGGWSGDGGSVTINGGTVIASAVTTGTYASGIGGGGDGGGGAVKITGGSVKATRGGDDTDDIGSGGTINHGTLWNSSGYNVYRNTLTVGATPVANTFITAVVIGGVASYGVRNVKTDADGKVYFYLPQSTDDQEIKLTVGSKIYSGTYKRAADHNNAQTLVLPSSPVVVAVSIGGSISGAPATATEDSTVTLTVLPDAHYELLAIGVTKTGDAATTVPLAESGGTRSFVMPGYGVTVTASFKLQGCTERTPVGSGAWPCGTSGEDPLCVQDKTTCATSCSTPGDVADATTGKCPGAVDPDGSDTEGEGGAAPLKRSTVALAVIVAVLAWLM